MLRIITDSAADFKPEVVEALKIEVLPLTIHFGDEEFYDGITITHEEFYNRLTSGEIFPKTSQVTPYQYEQLFKQVAEAGDTAVVVCLASKLSGTYQSACLAARHFEDRVLVVDSTNATVGEQILVRRACELRDQGLTAKEVADILEEEKKEICLLGSLDTLLYLKKGGRISPAVAMVGGMLGIKPIACIRDGEILVLGKARGSKNVSAMVNSCQQKEGDIDFDRPVALGYAGNSTELLERYLKDSENLHEGRLNDIPVSTIGSTIGTHVGPGTVILTYFRKKHK